MVRPVWSKFNISMSYWPGYIICIYIYLLLGYTVSVVLEDERLMIINDAQKGCNDVEVHQWPICWFESILINASAQTYIRMYSKFVYIMTERSKIKS